MKNATTFSLAIAVLFGLMSQVFAAPKVVTTIRPLHSIVASVMKGVGDPALLLDGATSPHDAALKPSQARSIQEADMVVLIGPALETFLKKAVENIGDKAVVLEMMEVEGLTLHALRGRHDDHGKDDHDKDDHKDHDHDKKAHKDDDHDDHKEDAHKGHNHEGNIDAHVWLDPRNAKIMADAVATALTKMDADNAQTYSANAQAFAAQMDALEKEIATAMKETKDRPYFVQHDAYQYFEKRFGLKSPTPLSIDVRTKPGVATVRKLKETIAGFDNPCLLTEPQFNVALADSLFAGTGGKRGVIDPLGQDLGAGPDHYAQTVRNLAQSVALCLSN